MKTNKLPFLFFCVVFLRAFVMFSQETDSISYYVNFYKQAQNSAQVYKAMTFFQKQKEQALLQNSYERAAYFMYHTAAIDMRFDNLYESEKVAVEALKVLDRIPKSSYTPSYKLSLYNHLGILKRRLNDYENSLRYYNKSLTFSPKKSDSALAFNNMGIALIYMEKYEMAREKLVYAVDNFRTLNDSAGIALCLNSLGLVKSKLNEPQALDDLNEALEIRKRIGDNKIYESYKNISDYYKDQKDDSLAIVYAVKGYEKSKTSGNLSNKFEAVRSLIDLGKEGYGAELLRIYDQIHSFQKQNDIKYAMAKYDYANEVKKTEQAELDRERAEVNKTIYQLIGLSIFIIAIFSLLYMNGRNTKNAIKKEFETEQRISRTLHDEVANEVFYMMNNIQREDVQQYELLDTLEEVYEKVRDISKANSEVSVAQDYDVLIDDLIMKYANEDVNIIKDSLFEVPWDEISKDKKRVLYRVIQELMTNMKKHSKADLVSFSFEKKRRKLEVKYADNGVGCDLEKGSGLQNVESRIKMVKGHVTFDSKVNDGFYVNIIL